MTVIERITQLDALPAGSAVEILDKRGSVRIKNQAGDWIDSSKPADTTWNVWTYVNTRRYGARVIKRGITEVSDPIKDLEQGILELISYKVQEVKGQVIAMIKEYEEREAEREKGIQSFLDAKGDLKKGFSYSEYDEVVDDSAQEAREDLGKLLASLRKAFDLPAQV